MDPDVVAPDMVPSFCSLPDGPPLLDRVRAAGPFPTSRLVCSPPTPSFRSASDPVFPVILSVIIAPAQSRCSFADFSKRG